VSGTGDSPTASGFGAFDQFSPFTVSTGAVSTTGREWAISSTAKSVKSGSTTFTFRNGGTIEHELVVVKTDLTLGDIPIDPVAKKFDEEDPSIEVIGEVFEIEAGSTGNVVLDLPPGNYQLVCNLAGHYANGMHVALRVTN